MEIRAPDLTKFVQFTATNNSQIRINKLAIRIKIIPAKVKSTVSEGGKKTVHQQAWKTSKTLRITEKIIKLLRNIGVAKTLGNELIRA